MPPKTIKFPAPPASGASEEAVAEWLLVCASLQLSAATPGSIAARDAMGGVRNAHEQLRDVKAKTAPPKKPEEPAPEAIVDEIVAALPGWHPAWVERLLFRAAEVLELDLAPALDAHHRVEL